MKYIQILTLVALALFPFTEAKAAASLISISQTNAFTVNPTQTLTWNQFDSSLGTLTGITFEASSGLTGTFTVSNLGTGSMNARKSQAENIFQFLGSGSPGLVFSDTLTPINTSPVSNNTGTEIFAGQSQVFTITAGQSLSLPNTSLFSYANYFIGTGSVLSSASMAINITSTGASYTVNSDANVWSAPCPVVFPNGTDLEGWRNLTGNDLRSVEGDPRLADPAHGNFTVLPDSPAWPLGGEAIDLSSVGPLPGG